MKKIITSIALLLLYVAAIGQQAHRGVFKSPVIPGPNGVFVYATDSARRTQKPSVNQSYIIFKEEKKGAGFKKMAALNFPATAAELEKRMGIELLQSILQQRKLRSAQDLYDQLKRGRFDTLGIFSLASPVLEALGMLYIDHTVTTADPSVSYRLVGVYNGNEHLQYQLGLGAVQYDAMPSFKKYRATINDSAAMVTWYATRQKAAYATVFTNAGTDSETKFNPGAQQFIYVKKDTLFVTYTTRTTPGKKLVAYLQPEDLAGNRGEASDTVHLLAIGFNDRVSIENLTAKDTLGSVRLTWKSLPAKAWCSGIEVLKSRFATTDYVVIDTLPITAVEYRDRHTISGNIYYYQLRPLLFDLPQKGRITPATVNVRTIALQQKIIAPQGLQLALHSNAAVRLNWLPNAELNIFAYYILRGTARANMQVISPAIRDTVFIDSLKGVNTGTTYLYAVAAVDMNMQWSDTSAPVAMQSPRASLATAPGGIQARASAQGVRLTWNNVAITDASVTGYLLYRRNKGETYFIQLNKTPLPGTYFTDSSSLPAGDYEYGCSAVDAWNHVSILSPLASVHLVSGNNGTISLSPPAVFVLRNAKEGIEIKLPATATATGEKIYAQTNTRYNLYRRLVTEKTFRKIGAMAPGQSSYTDRQVIKDQLYAYTVSLQQEQEESNRSAEKSIRRK
ncbi:MAG: fibronectin type III domain-containing protein [Chitinophagaceae bacterium]